ncbi:hypothetical protein SAMN05421788_104183 [Filimonas lacunae]|uniref:YdhG-like domain-containing protein n=1 Tax=Filimonas lacunae TaxID=477680 RepID=A0A173M988_9BACT|nr:DUF1801 domain-containing protein [Filimonas lacunae]BAV04081.1 leucyl-tRNA synthetase [Filimonas lacunae]SIT15661.1 hypothetical protein SAMN05421788_104183 [Filimonas lacunae]
MKTDPEVQAYHNVLHGHEKEIAALLYHEICKHLPDAENKVWHGHPVWFLDGNPIVGYDKRKDGFNLLFWSGQSFDEPALKEEGKFKAAEIRYTNAHEIDTNELMRWLGKARDIQWDYKNLVKRKGVLERLK